MPRGGARVNSGPAPDPNALRRDRKQDRDGWTTLPAKGREGATPPWPLPGDLDLAVQRDLAEELVEDLEEKATNATTPAARKSAEGKLTRAHTKLRTIEKKIELQDAIETKFWAELWATPQAVAWEQLGWVRDVAQYVRHKVRGELGQIKDAQEARQWSDRLGLNPSAMLRLRWRVSVDEVAARRGAVPAGRAAAGGGGGGARARLAAVKTDGGA